MSRIALLDVRCELEFSDDPARLAARAAHRERLMSLHAAGQLVMAGPWADDPYYATPGVRVKSLREWQPIVG